MARSHRCLPQHFTLHRPTAHPLPTRCCPHFILQELKDHVMIMGYGRSGQLIAQILSENLIPFVAIDSSSDRVATGKVRGRGG